MQRWRLLHPFLLAVYPVLFLFTQNAADMRIAIILPSLGIALATTTMILGALWLILRDTDKSGLVTSLMLVAFFSYGHLLNLGRLAGANFGPNDSLPNGLLLVILLIAVTGMSYVTLRTRSSLKKVTSILNIVAALMVVVQLAIAGYYVAGRISESAVPSEPSVGTNLPAYRPDIYYIVVDAYARQDILKEVFDYDNSDFLDHLRQLGFYIADSSHSNYARTLQSLASSLNTEYLDRLGDFGANTYDRVPLSDFIQSGTVLRGLKILGYNIVSFISGYDVTTMNNADATLTSGIHLSEFENLLVSTTPLSYLLGVFATQHDRHRERVLYMLEKLPQIDEVASPFFVFAHIVSPHPPFLFDDYGNPGPDERPFSFSDGNHYFEKGGDPDQYVSGYRSQIRFVTGQLQRCINRLLVRYGNNPPIIIIQGDHGSGLHLDWNSKKRTWHRERFSILNAYYLPGQRNQFLYPSITPVNTFRVIFNSCFGLNFDLRPDRSFYSVWKHPFLYDDITDRLNDELPPATSHTEESVDQ